MKTLIFAPFACAFGHHETELEVALTHLKKEDEVHIIQCRKELIVCDPNPSHSFLRCLSCSSTSTASFLRAGVPSRNLHALKLSHALTPDKFPTFNTIEELNAYRWNGLPAGHGVAMSTIALHGDTSPDMIQNEKFIRDSLAMWVETYHSIQFYLKKLQPDFFYLFNGRCGVENAALIAARDLGIKPWVLERGLYEEYTVYQNARSIDLDYIQDEIETYRKRMEDDLSGQQEAEEWFRIRTKDQTAIGSNFLENQKHGELPPDFNPNLRNIALFLSSEHENYLTPGWENPVYSDQSDAITKLVSAISDNSFHFHIRIHPNLKTFKNHQTKALSALHFPNATIIPADSSIDTYTLLRACEKTVTFGSTVGIEATYWGKPSILIGRSFAEKLNVHYRPTSHEEAVAMITGDLKPLPSVRAIPYAYWYLKSAIKFKYVDARRETIKASGGFNGTPILPSRFVQFLLVLSSRWFRLKFFLNNTVNSLRRFHAESSRP